MWNDLLEVLFGIVVALIGYAGVFVIACAFMAPSAPEGIVLFLLGAVMLTPMTVMMIEILKDE